MNSDILPSGEPHESSLRPVGQQQLQAWRELLGRCALKPSRKRVHALRIATLRLQSLLEYLVREQAADAPAMRAFKRWKKQAKKLNRVLRPVRDFQVQRRKLKGLSATLAETPDRLPKGNGRYLREIKLLESRLGEMRQSKSDELVAWIEGHRKRLRRLSTEMERLLMPEMLCGADSSAETALQLFSGLTKDFPRLNGGNLHDYRQRLRKLVYLTEISAATDPRVLRLAAAFKKMVAAAGDWHDWQILAEEVDRALPGHGKESSLATVLKTIEKRCLRKALALCRRSTALLLMNKAD